MCLRGDFLARGGRREEAQAILEEVTKIAQSRYVDPYDVARIYMGLGDTDGAFEWLERALHERSTWLIWLKVSPFSDVLRDDPRFDAILARVGLSS
jgi:serine/threonine-protein kinase